MTYKINELCRDPLFQLNLAIWLAQEQPIELFCVNPLFYKSGLTIYSIPNKLTIPLDIQVNIAKSNLDCQEVAKPDLILETKDVPKKYCLLECKASSFGINSQNPQPVKQARTHLIISGMVISEVLGGRRGDNEGILCYLIGSDNIDMMLETLKTLKQEIKDKINYISGYYGCFQVKSRENAILLEYHKEIKKYLNLNEESPVKILAIEKDTDPRPLYFIPYDPNIQSKEEQALGRRILFERILSNIISTIGGTTNQKSVAFTTEGLLNSATFEIYERWDDNETKKQIRTIIKDYLMNIMNIINENIKDCITYTRNSGWIFNFKNLKMKNQLLKQLEKFKPEMLDLSKEISETLFDVSPYMSKN